MRTIRKYEIKCPIKDGISQVDVPEGARITKYGFQGELLMLWALVDPEKEMKTQYYRVFCTGDEIKDPVNMTHCQTLFKGELVLHVFRLSTASMDY